MTYQDGNKFDRDGNQASGRSNIHTTTLNNGRRAEDSPCHGEHELLLQKSRIISRQLTSALTIIIITLVIQLLSIIALYQLLPDFKSIINIAVDDIVQENSSSLRDHEKDILIQVDNAFDRMHMRESDKRHLMQNELNESLDKTIRQENKLLTTELKEVIREKLEKINE